MKELFKRIKMDVIVSAVVCIAFGVVLILWPAQVTTIACKIVGAVIAVLGLVRTITAIVNSGEKNGIALTLGMILFIVGIWIFMKPESIQNLICIGIGVALLVHGLEDFKYAIETKRNGYTSWWAILIMAVPGILFGIICIVDSFGVISVAMTFVGIALIYDGLSDLWIISRVKKTARTIEQEMGAVDVEYEEREM